MSTLSGKITWVLRGLVLFAFLGVIVPLALVPITTSLPTRIALGVVAGVFMLAILAVAVSQAFASTPAITDAQGHPLPNSIAVLEQVRLNGSKQWITIRGKNKSNPVLLYLAGGPGGGELPVTRTWLGALEDHFVVVNWDQPGCGKSYHAVPLDQLTPQRYVEDAHALAQMLCTRFRQDKLYVLGGSWGSILGIMLVQQYPDLFRAFIGAGQMVNTTENDVLGYELALTYAAQHSDTKKTVERLRRNGPPPYTSDDMALKYQAYLGILNRYMWEHARGESGYHDLFGAMLRASEYGWVDKVNWARGLLDTYRVVYTQLEHLDFTQSAARLEVPVYFLEGRFDVNAMTSLVERYYNILQAPHKEMIWFEQSGHTPMHFEPNRVVEVLVKQVLAQTSPAMELKEGGVR